MSREKVDDCREWNQESEETPNKTGCTQTCFIGSTHEGLDDAAEGQNCRNEQQDYDYDDSCYTGRLKNLRSP
jgi:hypothetical protein